MEASTVAIEVQYGDIVRRFNAQVVVLSLGRLTEKIFSLFNFAPDTKIMLTFTVGDGDSFVIVDDDTLRDVVKHFLKPLRITVARAEQSFQNPNAGVPDHGHTLNSFTCLRDLVQYEKQHNSGQGQKKKKMLRQKMKSKTYMTMIWYSNIRILKRLFRSSNSNLQRFGDCFSTSQRVSSSTRANESSSPAVKVSMILVSGGKLKRENIFSVSPNLGIETPHDIVILDLVLGVGLSLQSRSGDMGFTPPEVQPGVSKLDSCFMLDLGPNKLNVVVEPSTPFTKVWRIVNNGTVAWPQKTRLVWIGGPKLSDLLSFELEIPATGLDVGQELNVAVDLISPESPGWFTTYWRMASPSGQKFGQLVWVVTAVVERVERPASWGPIVETGGISKLDGCVIRDWDLTDSLVISPSTPFTKIWRVRNKGTVAWPQKTRLVWIDGEKLSNLLSVEVQDKELAIAASKFAACQKTIASLGSQLKSLATLEIMMDPEEWIVQIPATGLAVGQELDVAVDLISPRLPRHYISYWRLTSPSGQMFGQLLSVLIWVD